MDGNPSRFYAGNYARLARRLSEITKADVRKLIEGVAKRGAPIGANRLLTSLKTFLAFAVEHDVIIVSPAASVRAPGVEKARERVLVDRIPSSRRPGGLP